MPRIIERINKRIPVQWRNHSGLIKALAASYKVLCSADQEFSKKLKTAAASCADSGMDPGQLQADMVKEYASLGISPEEYARFRFFEKDETERSTFIPDMDVINIFKWKKGNNILPDSKYDRYCMFQPYFHRDVIRIQFPFTEADSQNYQKFISDKETFILKPLKGTKGHGILKLETRTVPDLNALAKITDGECLLEETIRQGKELKQFHPASVNTARLVTGKGKDGKIDIVFALLRVGRGGSVVDNVGSGGFVALVDLTDGRVCTDAFCGTERYEKHPDTGVVFKGSMIPEWKKLCETGIEIHRTHSGQRVFGFDFAWTEKGWDLVEVNPAPSFASFQSLTQKGCRPLLEEKQLI